jgi:hypothetical protein
MSKLALAILAALPCGFAGTIINTNLPAGDIIVDINGQQDGAANYGGPNQDLWYQPFNTGSTLLEVTLQPGTYAFRVIFPALTSTQLAEIGSHFGDSPLFSLRGQSAMARSDGLWTTKTCLPAQSLVVPHSDI